jgi:hypothetical protein
MPRVFALAFFLLLAGVPVCAQTPVTLDVGLGGGVSLPAANMSDGYNTGYHGGGKVRLSGWLPVNLVASGWYNTMPEKTADQSDTQVMVGGGIELAIISAGVHPYFGLDAFYTEFTDKGPVQASFSRGGLGIGAGVEFSLEGFGSFDTSLKYQYMNAMGKASDSEPTFSQIAATVTLMFGLL